MQPQIDKIALMKKRIPTIAGLAILVIGLVVGVVFLGTGPGVFAPRATPETTPSKIRLTNVTDSGFTVSFYTAGATPGFIKYGTETNSIKSQTGDDRDQLSGTIGEYKLHHVTVRGLKPSTTYYYVLGTGSSASFDNNGAPFKVKTAARGGAPSAAKTAYGNVLDESGNPANGVIVYASMPGIGEMSTLVKSSGSWAIPLANARKEDGTGYATIEDTDNLTLFVQGTSPTNTSELTVSVGESQPVADITLGKNGPVSAADTNSVTESSDSDGVNLLGDRTNLATDPIETTQPVDAGAFENRNEIGSAQDGDEEPLETFTGETPQEESTSTAQIVSTGFGQSDSVGGLSGISEFTESGQTEDDNTYIFIGDDNSQVSKTQKPVIGGLAKPNVKVMVQINSETQIEQELTADENGYFEVDIEALKQDLEPGEHTATYTYTDPETGEEVTKTVAFTVEPDGTDTGLGGTQETTPYGSGNPYTIEATGSAEASDSGEVATRSAVPATDSAIPVSGSVGTTMALVLGGIFFIIAGGWSYYLATQIEVKEI